MWIWTCANNPKPSQRFTAQSLSVDLTYESLRGSYREPSRLDERCLLNMLAKRVGPHYKFMRIRQPASCGSSLYFLSNDYSLWAAQCFVWFLHCLSLYLTLERLRSHGCSLPWFGRQDVQSEKKVDSAEVKVPEVWSHWLNTRDATIFLPFSKLEAKVTRMIQQAREKCLFRSSNRKSRKGNRRSVA